MYHPQLSLQIVQAGAILPVFPAHDTLFVLVPETLGEYVLRVRSDFNRDVLVVLSVDGLDVMSGKPADYRSDGGYVLHPHEVLDVPGWRRDDGHVAAFSFRQAEGSYSAQMGHGTANVGIVGCAAFQSIYAHQTPRRQTKSTSWFPPWDDMQLLGSAGFSGGRSSVGHCSTSMPQKEACLSYDPASMVGTGYGRETEHHVRTVSFRKANEGPDQVVTLRYATRSWLAAQGFAIPPAFDLLFGSNRPQAFPGVACPPPPGWDGR